MSIPKTHESVQQEEDILPPRLILYIILAVIAFSLLLVAISYGILRSRERVLRPSGEFPEQTLGPIVERSNVHEELYGNVGRGQVDIRAGQQWLERFEWVDRERRIVRVPMDTAIELYVNSRGQ